MSGENDYDAAKLRIYDKLEDASGKLDLLMQYVRQLSWMYLSTSTDYELKSKELTEKIALLFTPSELNQLSWIKDVYNRSQK